MNGKHPTPNDDRAGAKNPVDPRYNPPPYTPKK